MVRRRACKWGGRPTRLYLAADGSQPTTGPLGPPAPPTASHTASSHHNPSRFPQDRAASFCPCLCSSLHLPHLPPTSPCPQASEKHTISPVNSAVQHPIGGAGLPFLLISIVPMPLVPRSCGLLICPRNSHSPGPCVCLALGTLGMPTSAPGSIGDDERFLPPPLHSSSPLPSTLSQSGPTLPKSFSFRLALSCLLLGPCNGPELSPTFCLHP